MFDELINQFLARLWIAGFVAGLSVSAAPSDTEEPAPKATKAEFGDRVLAITTKTGGGYTCFLEEVQVKQIGSQTFLAGKVIEESSQPKPAAGKMAWVAVDAIDHIVEIGSKEEARKMLRAKEQAVSAGSSFGSEASKEGRNARNESAKKVESNDDVYELNVRSFRIPIQVDPGSRQRVSRVILLLSTDEGRTWNKADERGADDKAFDFHADRDGTYWFAVQAKWDDGTLNPPSLKDITAGMKVRVKTNGETPNTRSEAGDTSPEVECEVGPCGGFEGGEIASRDGV